MLSRLAGKICSGWVKVWQTRCHVILVTTSQGESKERWKEICVRFATFLCHPRLWLMLITWDPNTRKKSNCLICLKSVPHTDSGSTSQVQTDCDHFFGSFYNISLILNSKGQMDAHIHGNKQMKHRCKVAGILPRPKSQFQHQTSSTSGGSFHLSHVYNPYNSYFVKPGV